jgi:polysaccharide biosynthesis transport protein
MLDMDRELAGIDRPGHGAPARPGNEFAGRLEELRRWWWLPLLCAVVAAAAGYGLSNVSQRKYDATASLLFRDPAIDQRLFPGTFFTPSDNDPQRKAATNVRLVSLDAVARRVATGGTLGLSAAQVSKSVKVRPDGNSDVVAVTARRPTARGAAALANRYATEYVAFRRDADRAKILQAAQLVRAQRSRLGADERDLRQGRILADRASQLETLAAVQTGNAEIVERAEVPTSQAAPHPKRSGMIGGILGLLLGLGLTIVLSRLDQRLRDSSEASALLGAPVLAEISTDRRLASRPTPDWIPGEETPEGFRLLRTTLRYFRQDGQSSMTILVTSAAPGEGKTTTSWNLAVAAASDGDAVLLVEADLRRPRILPAAIRTDAGLAPLLAGLMSFDEAVMRTTLAAHVEEGSEGRLDVLPAGACPPNPLQLVQSRRMHDLLNYVGGRYDLVVVDSPAVTAVADALALVREVDGVVVVTRLGVTTRGQVQELGRNLQNIGASVLGIVINGSKDRAPSYYADPGG